MTQTGSPDPQNDLVCITSSCPRQFLQNFSSLSSLPLPGSGLTSLNCSRFNATTLWHFDAAEWAVAVGTEISLRPPHRSRRALLTHRAPTLDGDEEPLFRARVQARGGPAGTG